MFRCGKRQRTRHWPKLSAVCDCRSHFFVAAKVSKGPSYDSREAGCILKRAQRRGPPGRILLDAAYDSEALHRFIREHLAAESIIPPLLGRPSRKKPRGKYRRIMKRNFPAKAYGQRWQIESAFSRLKRLLGSALRATSWMAQKREVYLRLLVHNLMILLCPLPYLFNRATSPSFLLEISVTSRWVAADTTNPES